MSDEPRGVVTDGQGQQTTAHLNLTRTMADVERGRRELRKPEKREPSDKPARRPMMSRTGKIAYAGYDWSRP